MNEPVLIPLEDIEHNPYQPRKSEDPAVVAEIAESIQRNGLMQIPTARLTTDGRYQLAFGHTRLAAFKQLLETALHDRSDFAKMPVMLRDLTDLQMFELGVAENIKRRDLNPIELARAMQTYLDPPFSKTSEQAGEFFNVSAETVRGTVRLLNLPVPIQEKVRSGDLNVSTARKLLTVQRINPAAAVKAADEILKLEAPNGEDIDNELEDAVHADGSKIVEMWSTWQKGEPRGGHHLWPLNWQHKGSLAAMMAPEVLKALDLKKKDAKKFSGGVDVSDIVVALVGGMRLDPALYPIFGADAIEKLNHLADPPTCLDCPFYTRLRDHHYCGMAACWDRKAEAWIQKDLARLSKDMGIAIYDPADEHKAFIVHDSNWGPSSDRMQTLIKKKDASLRLIVRRRTNDYPGTDHNWIAVVDISDRAEKSERAHILKEKRDGAVREKENQLRQRAAEYEAISEQFVNDVAAPVLAKVFEGITCVEILLALSGFANYSKGWKQYKSLQPAKQRRFLQVELMRAMLMGEGDYGELIPHPYYQDSPARHGPVALAKCLEGKAKSWGVKLPKDWTARAQALMPKPVTAETAKAKKKTAHSH